MKSLIVFSAVVVFAVTAVARAAEAPAPAKPATASTTSQTTKKADTASTGKPAPSQLGMSVTGTQDSPKVLYIVPWKTIDAVPAEPYVSGLLDEVFAPVDPVEFERSVHQHQQLQTPAEAGIGP